jgi:putative sterol carrier protein
MAKVPENAKKLFDEEIPAALEKHGAKANEIGAVYLFKIAGDGGGEWTVDLAAKPPTCTQGDKGNAQCTFEVQHADFMQMITNPAMGMQLYFQGKLKVTGDPMLATKLQKLFSLTE